VNLFAGQAQRIKLDETSWIEHVPGWLPGEDAAALLARLIASAVWEQRDRWMVSRRVLESRLTAEYADIADAPDPALILAAEALSARYQVPYDGLWINYYRNHRDSTGWHGDWPTCKRPECIVPALSLGAPRRFLIKPRRGGRSIGFTPRAVILSSWAAAPSGTGCTACPSKQRPSARGSASTSPAACKPQSQANARLRA
jgi:alkylated DNA repair dioxygenase AlkB